MDAKTQHKQLKKEVNELETQRAVDRSTSLWSKIKEMKKLKLKAKEKLNAIKLR
jgi:hypothetical protein